jgi:hypothetical protein
MAASRHAHGEDGAFVDDAIGQGQATAVMRINREGRHRDGIFLGGLCPDVFF